MEATELDSNGYGGTYKLVGGRLAFDFVNTISRRAADRHHDWLSSPENVTGWLAAVGLDADVPIRDADIPVIHALRATIGDAVSPLAHGQPPTPAAIESLNVHIALVGAELRINPHTLEWQWDAAVVPIDLFRPVVDDAAHIVVGGVQDRVKCCPSCDWLFEDQTRNGQRRWCDMADCGSRAKSREYYHRTRKATP